MAQAIPVDKTPKGKAGRPVGRRNRKTLRFERNVTASGMTPLEYMLRVMRDTKADKGRRDEMAKAAAPYVHPKLQATEHSGPNGSPIQTRSVVVNVDPDKHKGLLKDILG